MSTNAADSRSKRDLEGGIERDFRRKHVLRRLPATSTCCSPRSTRSAIRPSTTSCSSSSSTRRRELWLKLLVHELRSARALLAADDLAPALKRLARVKHVQHALDRPVVRARDPDPERVRRRSGRSSRRARASSRRSTARSSSSSATRTPTWSRSSSTIPRRSPSCGRLLHEPSLYDEFLAYLARRGYAVPAALLDRDWSQPYRLRRGPRRRVRRGLRRAGTSTGASTRPARSSSTSRTTSSSGGSGTCRWSSAPSATRPGTGGSTGVDFLRRALDLTFFPELYEVRTRIGS